MLQPNVDYTVKYKNNTKAGTATVTITGKGNYVGSFVKTFVIHPLDLNKANVLDVTVPYNGKVQKGTTTVTYLLNGKTVTLKKGTDFTTFIRAQIPKQKVMIKMRLRKTERIW